MNPVRVAEMQQSLRNLWLGHIYWVQYALLNHATNSLAERHAAEKEVVANVQQIANTVTPFYGEARSEQLFTKTCIFHPRPSGRGIQMRVFVIYSASLPTSLESSRRFLAVEHKPYQCLGLRFERHGKILSTESPASVPGCLLTGGHLRGGESKRAEFSAEMIAAMFTNRQTIMWASSTTIFQRGGSVENT